MTRIRTGTTAREIMSTDPVCAAPSMTLRQVSRLLVENDISGAPVVDESGRVVGVISKTDLVRRLAEGGMAVAPAFFFESLEESGEDVGEAVPETEILVEECMAEEPITVKPEATAQEIARLMCDTGVHRVVVIDGEGFPEGIITTLDLLGVLAAPAEAKHR